jgi:hypothetical protein
MMNHEYEDVSYHGSPTWECRFCGVHKQYGKDMGSCSKAEKILAKEAAKKEQEEFYEYKRLKAAEERYEYLKEKFGNKEGDGINKHHEEI